jgi:hypothetical protein
MMQLQRFVSDKATSVSVITVVVSVPAGCDLPARTPTTSVTFPLPVPLPVPVTLPTVSDDRVMTHATHCVPHLHLCLA